MEAIISIAKAIAALMPFTSQFRLLKYICEQCTIFGIAWIDKTLFFVANILATGLVWLIASKTTLSGKAKGVASIIAYLLILSVFADKVFWYVVGGILVIAAGIGVGYLISQLRKKVATQQKTE